jgi:hypothetical protein
VTGSGLRAEAKAPAENSKAKTIADQDGRNFEQLLSS